MYSTIFEDSNYRFQTSRLGDVIVTRKKDKKEVYFQPGDTGSEMISILEESPPEIALDIFVSEYF